MFLVINKEKIYAYTVSTVTVIMLFSMANIINENQEKIEASADIVNEINIENEVNENEDNIYSEYK